MQLEIFVYMQASKANCSKHQEINFLCIAMQFPSSGGVVGTYLRSLLWQHSDVEIHYCCLRAENAFSGAQAGTNDQYSLFSLTKE